MITLEQIKMAAQHKGWKVEQFTDKNEFVWVGAELTMHVYSWFKCYDNSPDALAWFDHQYSMATGKTNKRRSVKWSVEERLEKALAQAQQAQQDEAVADAVAVAALVEAEVVEAEPQVIHVKDMPHQYSNIFAYKYAGGEHWVEIPVVPAGWERAVVGIRKRVPVLIMQGRFTGENVPECRPSALGFDPAQFMQVIQYQPSLGITMMGWMKL